MVLTHLLGVTVLSALVVLQPGWSQPELVEAGASEPSSRVDQPLRVYIDKGACPGEGCSHGEWVVRAETELFQRPDEKGGVVAATRPYEIVRGLPGEV